LKTDLGIITKLLFFIATGLAFVKDAIFLAGVEDSFEEGGEVGRVFSIALSEAI
jgi:hypothetical protein